MKILIIDETTNELVATTVKRVKTTDNIRAFYHWTPSGYVAEYDLGMSVIKLSNSNTPVWGNWRDVNSGNLDDKYATSILGLARKEGANG